MRKTLLCLTLLIVGGCQAGTSAQLLGYDAIQAAALEASKGAAAQHQAVVAAQTQAEAQWAAKLGKAIAEAYAAEKLPPDDAAIKAGQITEKVVKDAANFAENRRRMNEEYATLTDNLQYINEQAQRLRDFSVFKASAEVQWAEYLKAQTRAQIERRKVVAP